jgi:hypothetical protein
VLRTVLMTTPKTTMCAKGCAEWLSE